MSEEKRIGVFICRCGRNIAHTVDIDKAIEEIKKKHDVAFIEENMYMCSDPGQNLLKEAIHSKDLNRVVVAACSRDMHEPTFMSATKEADLNPYLLEMANIREQVSWVHENKEDATNKAVKIIESAIERVKMNTPLTALEIPVTQKALVIGGGIAGIQSALDIADSGYDVTLIEKASSIGGHMSQLAETFPTLDCSQCILTPKMVAVSHHPKIELLTCAEVEVVDGFVGNFKVRIRKNPRYVTEMCNMCNDCVEVCPVVVHDEYNMGLSPRKAIYIAFPQAVPAYYVIDPKTCLGIDPLICSKCAEVCEQDAVDFDMRGEIMEDTFGAIIVATGYEPYPIESIGEYGYGLIPDVISGLEFERLLSANGPTAGVIRRPSDGKEPETVVFIHCTGSRDPAKHLPYCSKICCMYATKHALQFKHLNHNATAINFYIDVRTAGKDYEEFYKRAAEEERVIYIRGKVSELLQDGNRILIRGVNTIAGEGVELHADMVVLANGLIPSEGTKEISSILKLSCDSIGFIKEAHPKLKPVETAISGVFVAGTASGPKDIPETVSNASAAAAKAITILSHKTLERPPQIAEIEQTTCGKCHTCIHVCPYGAIYYDSTSNKVLIREALCEGCGSCAAACPSGSIELKNSTYRSISASIKALLKGEEMAQ
ncbi:MAG: CoB--CoM heterodisulfide reductase iron-sulfur subunit A family protein [Candidatus Lokiarchaeota archaeon]|nr:CoB--CoM heterodisulfide reductase iron-sulfur subunit A family protein [Candidatus Lokiarchaeota archaeon]